MIIDNKEDYAFSEEFHKQASANNGIAIMEGELMYWVTSTDISPEHFDPDIHAYCGFKCYRDLQSFLAVRGWTAKEVYTGIIPPKKKVNDKPTCMISHVLPSKISESSCSNCRWYIEDVDGPEDPSDPDDVNLSEEHKRRRDDPNRPCDGGWRKGVCNHWAAKEEE